MWDTEGLIEGDAVGLWVGKSLGATDGTELIFPIIMPAKLCSFAQLSARRSCAGWRTRSVMTTSELSEEADATLPMRRRRILPQIMLLMIMLIQCLVSMQLRGWMGTQVVIAAEGYLLASGGDGTLSWKRHSSSTTCVSSQLQWRCPALFFDNVEMQVTTCSKVVTVPSAHNEPLSSTLKERRTNRRQPIYVRLRCHHRPIHCDVQNYAASMWKFTWHSSSSSSLHS